MNLRFMTGGRCARRTGRDQRFTQRRLPDPELRGSEGGHDFFGKQPHGAGAFVRWKAAEVHPADKLSYAAGLKF